MVKTESKRLKNKWREAKNYYKDLQLHMLGKLQTNKVKNAVKLFDYIHSLDNDKLALKLSQYEKELSKKNQIIYSSKSCWRKSKIGSYIK